MFFLTKKNNIFKNALSIKKMVFADDLFKESKKRRKKRENRYSLKFEKELSHYNLNLRN